MNSEIISKLLELVVTVLCLIVTTYVVPYIQTKIKGTKMEDFLTYVEKCVKWANQTIPAEEWQRKKAEVTVMVKDFANDTLKLELSDSQIDAIIEAAVYTVKEGIK